MHALPVPDYPSLLLIARTEGGPPPRPLRAAPPPFEAVMRRWWPGLLRLRSRPGESIVLTDDHAPIERLIDATLRAPRDAAP